MASRAGADGASITDMVADASVALPARARRRRLRRSMVVAIAVVAVLALGGLATASTPRAAALYLCGQPTRLADTRAAMGLSGALAASVAESVQVTGTVATASGPVELVPVGATAVIVTVTALDATTPGYLAIGPQADRFGDASLLNVAPDEIESNTTVVALSPTGSLAIVFEAYRGTGNVGVLVDIAGFYAPADDSGPACGPAGATGPAGPAGPQGEPGAGGTQVFGSFYDTRSQAMTTPPQVLAMPFSQTATSSGISVVSGATVLDGSAIVFDTAGVYNIEFSTQYQKEARPDETVEIWVRRTRGGLTENLEWTSTQVIMGSTKRFVAAWNFMIEVEPGDQIELVWWSDKTDIEILARPAAVDPVRPGIPSVILTVYKVG